ncbi:MAG: ribosome silencing factor [Lachnospiraceae bacterium]|nr:ribosome silencing factor [Lachnospiraceae bacterium]
MDSKECVKIVVEGLQDKKANDIHIIDIREISTMGDYFIIADGSNRNQVQALSDSVEQVLSDAGVKLKNREGYANGGWILLDYYDIIIHIFSEEERSFYDLEHIWRDGKHIHVGDL